MGSDDWVRIVQKYGGTSVADIERIERVADRVERAYRNGHEVVVVVSAMGHTTDGLVAMAREIDRYPAPREMDALLSTGEQVSAALVAMALCKRGLQARSYTGWQAGIETEPVHGAARMTRIAENALQAALQAGVIAVVTGFQGISDGAVTTLGRGGSDTTAVAVAAVLAADACEIYTDVAGVFTTDPRVVPTARKLDVISYDEMLELANLGAQVLHPRAVENAKQFGVLLMVKSSFGEEEGTSVVAISEGFEQRDIVTGIAFEREVAQIALTGMPLHRHGLATVFGELASRGVNVDVIVQTVVQSGAIDVSFTVQEGDAAHALDVLHSLSDTLGTKSITSQQGLAKVSIVGAGMISNPGVAAQMFRVLADCDVVIHMVSTSEIKVSCIINAEQVNLAVQSLHQSFLERNC